MVTGADYEAHSAWVSTLENITGFTTQFDFQVGGTEPLADGIAFVIQRSGTSALGQPGGDLGYGGISEGVAFYFDVYNGSFTGLYGSGTNIDVNAAAGINFHNGDMMRVTLSYNGATMAESIEDLATNALFTTAYSVNIPATVGGTTGYVGFTGGTGGDNSIQDIYHWIFTSIPNAPANLVATPNSDKQATLTWTNNSGGDASYEIDRANDNFFTVNAVALSGPASTTGTGVYIDAALAGDTGYYYRVRALNSAGASAYTGTAAILTYCSAPASPAAIGGNGNVSMAWSPSGGASSYNLYRALASGGEGSTPYQSGIGSASYTDNSATNGTAYYYTVRAVNPTGAGPQSSEFSATPSASETFEQWQLAEFGSVPAAESAAAADTANPAGDGISNLMKYALDLNPYVQGSSGLPAGSVMAIGGSNYLTLTFLRPHPAPGDITYNVETTNSLPGGSWTPSVVVAGYPVNNGNGTETMRERSASPASSPSQFIRLRVTGP
jgi:hypothetical protein